MSSASGRLGAAALLLVLATGARSAPLEVRDAARALLVPASRFDELSEVAAPLLAAAVDELATGRWPGPGLRPVDLCPVAWISPFDGAYTPGEVPFAWLEIALPRELPIVSLAGFADLARAPLPPRDRGESATVVLAVLVGFLVAGAFAVRWLAKRESRRREKRGTRGERVVVVYKRRPSRRSRAAHREAEDG